MFHQLRLIDETRTDWKIRVRVTRMWISIGNNGNVIGMNMILLDSEDYHIHSFVFPAIWDELQNMIFEGNIYDFQNLLASTAIGTLRPVSSNISIVLTNSTIIHPVPLLVSRIPRHKFEITQLGEIYNLARSYPPNETPLYAIDIVGAVQDLQPVRVVDTHSGLRNFIRFNLYDGRNMVKIILWDEKIEFLAPLFEDNFEIEPILILSTMRARFCFGSLLISSSSASRVFINLDYDAVRVVRRRFLDQW